MKQLSVQTLEPIDPQTVVPTPVPTLHMLMSEHPAQVYPLARAERHQLADEARADYAVKLRHSSHGVERSLLEAAATRTCCHDKLCLIVNSSASALRWMLPQSKKFTALLELRSSMRYGGTH